MDTCTIMENVVNIGQKDNNWGFHNLQTQELVHSKGRKRQNQLHIISAHIAKYCKNGPSVSKTGHSERNPQ